jgi:hypothetical protein
VVLAVATVEARSVALFGLGLGSLIEIGASTVVLLGVGRRCSGSSATCATAHRLGFCTAGGLPRLQSTIVLIAGYRSHHSVLGIVWTALTAAVMFALAAGKARTGAALDNPVLRTEARVTTVGAVLACAVLTGLVLNVALGRW